MLEYKASLLNLPLKHPTTITTGTSTHLSTVIVRVTSNGVVGIGEAAPIERYGESAQSVYALYLDESRVLREHSGFDALLADLPPAARCGLDIALYDLLGKELNCPLWRLFGLAPTVLAKTSVTIYIDAIDDVLAAVRAHRNAPILKVKLGLGNEVETLEAIRSIYTGTMRIDANEGWSAEQAADLLKEVARLDIEFCEQPIPAGNPDQLRWIRERSRIPIIADEDARSAQDLAALIGCVDGVNVKLAKCGGIRAALQMIHTARALGFKVMLGCMKESSILITAAGHIAPLADWLDLDGNILLENDPFVGMTNINGALTLPSEPGLGIRDLATHSSAA